MKQTLIEKIRGRQAKIGVIGLGYVGLPLLIEFSKENFPVLGFDIDEGKTQKLKKGISYIKHIPADAIAQVFSGNNNSDTTTDL